MTAHTLPELRQRPFMQVDVFTATPYLGNPLAVVLDGTGLSDEAMQHFAHWTNLSETTFVLPPTDAGRAAGADYRVRIFTPGAELPFAGHPTLGTCYAWLAHGGQPREAGVVRQECGVGVVTLRPMGGPRDSGNPSAQGNGGRMAFAAPPLTRSAPEATHLARVVAALGLEAEQVLAAQSLNNGPEWLGLLLDSPDTVLALTPDHAALKALNQKVGVAAFQPPASESLLIARSSREARAFAAATGDATGGSPGGAFSGEFGGVAGSATGKAGSARSVTHATELADAATPHLWVRAFAAPVGVPEDPVTGSLNASLAQWLMADGLLPEACRHAYTATQGQSLGRDGLVFLSRDAAGQVWVGGDVAPCVQGTVAL